jgi:transcriptional regulator with XRE-family HTH domain
MRQKAKFPLKNMEKKEQIDLILTSFSISQRELAAFIGTDPSSLSKYCRGQLNLNNWCFVRLQDLWVQAQYVNRDEDLAPLKEDEQGERQWVQQQVEKCHQHYQRQVALLDEMRTSYEVSRRRWAALQRMQVSDSIFEATAAQRLQVLIHEEEGYVMARRPEIQREQQFKVVHAAYALAYWKRVLRGMPQCK